MEQLNKEPAQDNQVIYRTDSNRPGEVTAYPAVHLSRYEIEPIVWCHVNGIKTGMVR